MITQYAREPEVSNACRETTVNQNVVLHILSVYVEHPKNPTYAFQIRMNGWPVVEVFQSTSDICQLQKCGQACIWFRFQEKYLPVLVDWSGDMR